jgi:nicotinamide mononucleotide (NMN) deamidase PncC
MSTSSLSVLAGPIGAALKARKGDTISVFEATSGGLINASLLSVPGASNYYIGGANVYSGKGAKGIFTKDVIEQSQMNNRDNYKSRENYEASKVVWATAVARGMRKHMGTTWCVAESGAAGPTVLSGKEGTGMPFTAIAVSGPGVEDCILVQSNHRDREKNMWQFSSAALQLLLQCIEKAAGQPEPRPRL